MDRTFNRLVPQSFWWSSLGVQPRITPRPKRRLRRARTQIPSDRCIVARVRRCRALSLPRFAPALLGRSLAHADQSHGIQAHESRAVLEANRAQDGPGPNVAKSRFPKQTLERTALAKAVATILDGSQVCKASAARARLRDLPRFRHCGECGRTHGCRGARSVWRHADSPGHRERRGHGALFRTLIRTLSSCARFPSRRVRLPCHQEHHANHQRK